MSIAQKIASGFNTNGILVGANEHIYTRRRNLLDNGDMAIAQYDDDVVADVTSSGFYTLDRWQYGEAGSATVSLSQESNAALQLVSEFHDAFLVNVTTADADLEAGHNMIIRQSLLAKDVGYRVGQGTSRANPLTLSFWVKCVKTGLNVIDLRNTDSARSCSQSYTVNASDTWEFKTVTFPADTGGSVTPNDLGVHFQLNFWFSAGSTYTSGTLQTTWGALVAANRAVGQINHHDSTSNTVALSGVQLEIGSTATPFEKMSWPDNLHDCQLHYQKSYLYTTPAGHATNIGAYYSEIERYENERANIGGTFVRTFVTTPVMTFYALNGGAAGTLGDVSNCDQTYVHVGVVGVNSALTIDVSGWHGITLSTTVDNIVGYQWTAGTGY